jgi:hypothetical protein
MLHATLDSGFRRNDGIDIVTYAHQALAFIIALANASEVSILGFKIDISQNCSEQQSKYERYDGVFEQQQYKPKCENRQGAFAPKA